MNQVIKSIIDKNPKIIVVEGFDITGKSTIIREICDNNACCEYWEPGYDKGMTSDVLPYGHRYALGLALIDLVENGLSKEESIYVVSRGLPSSLVYNHQYNQGNNFDSIDFLSFAKSKYSDPSMIHVLYVQHSSMDYAERMYISSLQRDFSESYDKFESFEDYWKTYQKFDKSYIEYIDKICGSNYTVINPEVKE